MNILNRIISSIIRKRKQRIFKKHENELRIKLQHKNIMDCVFFKSCEDASCPFIVIRKEYEKNL